jgi:hypothetical protein
MDCDEQYPETKRLTELKIRTTRVLFVVVWAGLLYLPSTPDDHNLGEASRPFSGSVALKSQASSGVQATCRLQHSTVWNDTEVRSEARHSSSAKVMVGSAENDCSGSLGFLVSLGVGDGTDFCWGEAQCRVQIGSM